MNGATLGQAAVQHAAQVSAVVARICPSSPLALDKGCGDLPTKRGKLPHMTKRTRQPEAELIVAARELDQLNVRRRVLIERIGTLVRAIAGQDVPVERGARIRRQVSRTRRGRGGRPKGFRVSAATRAKLRAAWKRRKAAEA